MVKSVFWSSPKNMMLPLKRLWIIFLISLNALPYSYAQNIGDTTLAHQAYLEAFALSDQNFYTKSIQPFKKAMAAYRSAGAAVREVETMMDIADMFQFSDQLDSSFHYWQQARQMADQQWGNSAYLAHTYLGLSLVYGDTDQLDLQKEFALKAIDLYTILNDKMGLGFAHVHLAYYYDYIADYERVIQEVDTGVGLLKEALGPHNAKISDELNYKGFVQQIKGDYQGSLLSLRESLAISKIARGPIHPQHAVMHINLANSFYEIGNADSVLWHLTQAFEIRKEVYPPDHHLLGNCYNQLGVYYTLQHQYQKAIGVYQKVEANNLANKDRGDYLENQATLYNNLAYCFQEQGDYGKAINFYEKALYIREEQLGTNHPVYGRTCVNIATALSNLNRNEASLNYCLKSIEIFQKSSQNTVDLAQAYANAGISLLELDRFDEALDFYQKSIKMGNRQLDPGSPKLLSLYNGLALSYSHLGHTEKAINIYQTISEKEQSLRGRNPLHAAFQLNLAKAISRSSVTTALHYIQQALISVSRDFEQEDFLVNPSKNQLVLSKNTFPILNTKASLLLMHYREIPDSILLTQVLSTLQLAFDWQDSLLIYQVYPKSQQKWQAERYRAIESALTACMALYRLNGNPQWVEKAFILTERTRSLQLKAAFKAEAASQSGLVPIHLLDKEKDLKSQIAFAHQRLSRIPAGKPERSHWSQKIIQLNQQFDSLLLALEQDYPLYHRLKYEVEYPDIRTLQQYLQTEQAHLIEFYFGKDSLYTFSIKDQQLKMFSVAVDSLLQNQIASYLKWVSDLSHIKHHSHTPAYFQDFTKTGYSLYQNILAPVLESGTQMEKLILIPDGPLAYLPFEIFLNKKQTSTEFTAFHSLPYLIRDYAIRYAYSSNFLTQQPTVVSSSVIPFGGFAPSYEKLEPMYAQSSASRMNLSPLHFNQPEVEQIHQFMGGHSYTGSEASKAIFTDKAAQYQILHLAMHAITRKENPLFSSLVFSPDQAWLTNEANIDSLSLLHAYEIYGMKLNAELVVLSACNTGGGKWQAGEGVLSLARAFSHAGCSNLVMSLWPIDDISSQELMVAYYQNLNQGMGKADALRQAKLDYLKNPRMDHPFFWAAFVSIGNNLPIEAGAFPLHILIGLFIGILLPGGIWWYKTRKKP